MFTDNIAKIIEQFDVDNNNSSSAHILHGTGYIQKLEENSSYSAQRLLCSAGIINTGRDQSPLSIYYTVLHSTGLYKWENILNPV